MLHPTIKQNLPFIGIIAILLLGISFLRGVDKGMDDAEAVSQAQLDLHYCLSFGHSETYCHSKKLGEAAHSSQAAAQ